MPGLNPGLMILWMRGARRGSVPVGEAFALCLIDWLDEIVRNRQRMTAVANQADRRARQRAEAEATCEQNDHRLRPGRRQLQALSGFRAGS